jgi:alkylhydroperoxidase family enzyme
MARIVPLTDAEIPAASRPEFERQLAAHGRVTNMKRTLARNAVAFESLMTWYPLHDAVRDFLGARATLIFVLSISEQADCLVCSTYFRRHLIDSGENPDRLVLDAREEALADFGRQLARDSKAVPDAVMSRLSSLLAPDQVVTLTAFGGLMLATNVFINALDVDLDEYLHSYRKNLP